jgi:hypothetical protein
MKIYVIKNTKTKRYFVGYNSKSTRSLTSKNLANAEIFNEDWVKSWEDANETISKYEKFVEVEIKEKK